MSKHAKTHFELTPANANRLESFINVYNESPERVTARYKIGDVVNLALNQWLDMTVPREPGTADQYHG